MKDLFFHQIKQHHAWLAQSVARETLNIRHLKAVGSSPTLGCVILLQKSDRSKWWLSSYRFFFPGGIGRVELVEVH